MRCGGTLTRTLCLLSRAPPYLRLTVRGLGDQSRAVAHLKRGTRVFIEGPYGVFTRHARTTDKVVLIGAGVGITPLRALLEDLPDPVDATVIIRASTPADIIHRDEVAAIIDRRGGHFHEVVGSRHRTHLDAGAVHRLAPDIARSDVYVCGPVGFNELIVDAAAQLGVPSSRIHQEAFSF